MAGEIKIVIDDSGNLNGDLDSKALEAIKSKYGFLTESEHKELSSKAVSGRVNEEKGKQEQKIKTLIQQLEEVKKEKETTAEQRKMYEDQIQQLKEQLETTSQTALRKHKEALLEKEQQIESLSKKSQEYMQKNRDLVSTQELMSEIAKFDVFNPQQVIRLLRTDEVWEDVDGKPLETPKYRIPVYNKEKDTTEVGIFGAKESIKMFLEDNQHFLKARNVSGVDFSASGSSKTGGKLTAEQVKNMSLDDYMKAVSSGGFKGLNVA